MTKAEMAAAATPQVVFQLPENTTIFNWDAAADVRSNNAWGEQLESMDDTHRYFWRGSMQGEEITLLEVCCRLRERVPRTRIVIAKPDCKTPTRFMLQMEALLFGPLAQHPERYYNYAPDETH